eukprot:scaffold42691_cov78-Cyclotella_meneghiniana.AAC.10
MEPFVQGVTLARSTTSMIRFILLFAARKNSFSFLLLLLALDLLLTPVAIAGSGFALDTSNDCFHFCWANGFFL